MSQGHPEWAAWLREQFDNHPTIRRPADLAREAGSKPNGRPRIDPSTVTQWLRGRRPSYDLAMAAGEAFGRPISEALDAAGYRLEPERRGELVGPDSDAVVHRQRDQTAVRDAARELRRALDQTARGIEAARAAAAALAEELDANEE